MVLTNDKKKKQFLAFPQIGFNDLDDICVKVKIHTKSSSTVKFEVLSEVLRTPTQKSIF